VVIRAFIVTVHVRCLLSYIFMFSPRKYDERWIYFLTRQIQLTRPSLGNPEL